MGVALPHATAKEVREGGDGNRGNGIAGLFLGYTGGQTANGFGPSGVYNVDLHKILRAAGVQAYVVVQKV